MENLNRDKFTVIAWDLPGYGKSRPPDRDFSGDFYQRDAIWAYDLMKGLGHLNFSLIGWSDGGITSLMLASMHPESIRKMVVLGANSYIHPDEIKLYERMILSALKILIYRLIVYILYYNREICLSMYHS